MNWFVRWSWPQEFNRVLGGDCAGRMIETFALHQMVGGGPVAMAVEHRAGDAPTQHSRKRFLVGLGLPLCDNFLALRKAANVQTLFVCWSTTKTLQVGRVSFLDTFHIKKSNVQP
jgi:hypothetical protein